VITLQIKRMKSLVKGFPDCPDYYISPEHAYEEQMTSMLIEVAKAKVENPDITDI
jgi:hypothetical protein